MRAKSSKIKTSLLDSLHRSPSQSSNSQFIIHEGVKFKIVDEMGEWSRVVLADGKDGWVLNKHFIKS